MAKKRETPWQKDAEELDAQRLEVFRIEADLDKIIERMKTVLDKTIKFMPFGSEEKLFGALAKSMGKTPWCDRTLAHIVAGRELRDHFIHDATALIRELKSVTRYYTGPEANVTGFDNRPGTPRFSPKPKKEKRDDY